jgi:hypothetical protein
VTFSWNVQRMRTFRAVFLISMFQVHKNWLQGALRPEKEADRSSIVRFFWVLTDKSVILGDSKTSTI